MLVLFHLKVEYHPQARQTNLATLLEVELADRELEEQSIDAV